MATVVRLPTVRPGVPARLEGSLSPRRSSPRDVGGSRARAAESLTIEVPGCRQVPDVCRAQTAGHCTAPGTFSQVPRRPPSRPPAPGRLHRCPGPPPDPQDLAGIASGTGPHTAHGVEGDVFGHELNAK